MNEKLSIDPAAISGIEDSGIDAQLAEDRKEWLEAIEDIYANFGAEGVQAILASLASWSQQHHVAGDGTATINTPYLNTIAVAEEPDYPGDQDIEQKLENVLRWNAMAMVLQAQDTGSGVGGHIATYAFLPPSPLHA
jgi:pyruvate dehydrogenase E1 component